ncbi:hypothetical protein KFL_003860060 [Klebsormidium nitens]|uniref:Uncharacterized protein n=1 Tax=Klebsormidium nitens TaxID=105231 RepID=A0A1Y1IAE7_KLENI|nr:hypothetical protein KFL_003860060 [Klebsormidium nitens]|eukprot:GAQ87900.1 hypothetical protein KFL_003860060 [Klebsormidium nitens]
MASACRVVQVRCCAPAAQGPHRQDNQEHAIIVAPKARNVGRPMWSGSLLKGERATESWIPEGKTMDREELEHWAETDRQWAMWREQAESISMEERKARYMRRGRSQAWIEAWEAVEKERSRQRGNGSDLQNSQDT